VFDGQHLTLDHEDAINAPGEGGTSEQRVGALALTCFSTGQGGKSDNAIKTASQEIAR
jgi:hypothetical protein